MTELQVAEDPASFRKIGFIFLTFGQVTDNLLEASEMRAIAERMQQWIPEDIVVTDLLREVIHEFRKIETEDERRIQASDYAHELRERLSVVQRKRVIRDLILIGKADGRVSDGELGFVSAVSAIFEIDSGTGLELRSDASSP
jgi:uncharacterized tellurite resistance protein B-like protein